MQRISVLRITIMRNLFHLAFGLLSTLLFWLAQGILLLDRLICTVYDLPLWPKLHRRLCALRRCRTACALAAFVPVFLLPGAALLHHGVMITVDGRPVGLVENAEALTAAVDELEAGASALAGRPYTLPMVIQTCPMAGTANQFLASNELKDTLITLSGELDPLAVVSIDGKQAGICRSAAQAQTLLDRLKAQYTTPEDKNAHFVQQVRIDSVVAEASLAEQEDALYQHLGALLDVTATRRITYTESIPFIRSPAKTMQNTKPGTVPSARDRRAKPSSPPRSPRWTDRSKAALCWSAPC